eukprot:scaffold2639_cov361-Pavlova_lutheri.AAC.60
MIRFKREAPKVPRLMPAGDRSSLSCSSPQVPCWLRDRVPIDHDQWVQSKGGSASTSLSHGASRILGDPSQASW